MQIITLLPAMNKKSMLAYKEDRILTIQELQKLSKHTTHNGIVQSRKPLAISIEFNYNCRSNSKYCRILDISGRNNSSRRNNSSTAMTRKQARRTNPSSPLGEIRYHGFDSISTEFIALSSCVPCQYGHYPNGGWR
uniref:Uncharacterized protein n=1 Tax=Glossina pallidipes TaxID=7398 RepID=A0A1A9ZQT0_GLOPL